MNWFTCILPTYGWISSNVFSGINANECGGNIFNTSGVLTSPNYPGLYPHSLDCHWNITVPNGTIGIIISQFSVEYHRYCAYDRLSVSKVLVTPFIKIHIAARNYKLAKFSWLHSMKRVVQLL